MSIDWIHFTPWRSLLGGLMIGAAAAMLILYNGRIAGISGVLGGLLNAARGERGWRLAFLAGLVAAQLPLLLGDALPAATIAATPPVLIVAGLLVGLGTRYGAGCTSGHGVCGLARLSPRSLAATATFMLAGFLTVYLTHHLIG